jgi:hypothetical protein
MIAGGGNLNNKFRGKVDFQFVNILSDILIIQPSIRVHVNGLTTDKIDFTGQIIDLCIHLYSYIFLSMHRKSIYI